jgi:hypothetical protein
MLGRIRLPAGAIGHHRIRPGHTGAKRALVSACEYAEDFRRILLEGDGFHDRYRAVRVSEHPNGGGLPALTSYFEWKYLERYDGKSTARSERNTDRVAIYRPLLEDPESPIVVEDFEWVFCEPFDQLMRQTLLAWQMTVAGELGAADWVHIHVVPENNPTLRFSPGAGAHLSGGSMAEKWRSVLRGPNRYFVWTPSQVVEGVDDDGAWGHWRGWLRERYLT